MAKEKLYCINCGGPSHCAKIYKRKESELINDTMIREWTIEVCRHCCCTKCEKNQ